MQYTYKTKGTCSQEIHFEIEDGKLKNVQFLGGCNGNLKGIGSLVEGMPSNIAKPSMRYSTTGSCWP